MFWENFYCLCKSNNISPNTVCAQLGLSNATATHWKNGVVPKGEVLSKIADSFDCSVDYLLGRVNSPKLSTVSEEFNKLNAEGQQKVIEYISDLITNPRYKISKTIEFKPEDPEYVNYGRAVAFGGKVEESKLTAEDERNAQAALDRLRKQKK